MFKLYFRIKLYDMMLYDIMNTFEFNLIVKNLKEKFIQKFKFSHFLHTCQQTG